MSKQRAKTEPSITIPIKKVREFKIPPLTLKVSLDEQFKDYLVDVRTCFLFLERYAKDDPDLARLLEIYNAKEPEEKYAANFSLDKLVMEAGIDPGNFRRLIITTIDFLCTDDAEMKIRLSKGALVEKSLAIAMDESMPESYAERKGWLEFMGVRTVNKNQQLVTVNVDNSSKQVVQAGVVNGLPSFNSTLAETEKIASQTIKDMIAGQAKQLEATTAEVIDIEVAEKEGVLVGG